MYCCVRVRVRNLLEGGVIDDGSNLQYLFFSTQSNEAKPNQGNSGDGI